MSRARLRVWRPASPDWLGMSRVSTVVPMWHGGAGGIVAVRGVSPVSWVKPVSLRNPNDGLTLPEPGCARVSSMNDQQKQSGEQKPSGEWAAPEDGQAGSDPEVTGRSATDQSSNQPVPPPENQSAREQTKSGKSGQPAAKSGRPVSPAPNPAAKSATDAGAGAPVWRDQYLNERKKSRLFMVTTAVAVLLLIGSLFYAVGQNNTTQVADPGSGSAGLEEGHGSGFGGPGGGGGLGQPDLLMERFFNEDGSVNEEGVAPFKERAEQFGTEGQFADRLLTSVSELVASGEITQEQAEELLEALGLPSSGGGV